MLRPFEIMDMSHSYRPAYACISSLNEGGIGLHERLGFQHVGTFPQVGDDIRPPHPVRYRLLCQNTDQPFAPQPW